MHRRNREIGAAKLVLAARDMRGEPTPAEERLWQSLRRRSLNGTRFRRQYVSAPYILDFFCLQLGLAVEVDGKGHQDAAQMQYDLERTAFLNSKGITVLRFTNDQVEADLDGVISAIYDWTMKNK